MIEYKKFFNVTHNRVHYLIPHEDIFNVVNAATKWKLGEFEDQNLDFNRAP